MKKSVYCFLSVCCFMFWACGAENEPPRPVVNGIDFARYLGTWYEIARFDHAFEKNLVGTTANYSMREDGLIKVLNSGYKNTLNGEFKTAEGKAKFAAGKDNGWLKVSFFLNFYSDYLILDLDTVNYQYVIIGSKSPDYLWFLSRTPVVSEKRIEYFIEKAKSLGYDTDKLIWVKQKTR